MTASTVCRWRWRHSWCETNRSTIQCRSSLATLVEPQYETEKNTGQSPVCIWFRLCIKIDAKHLIVKCYLKTNSSVFWSTIDSAIYLRSSQTTRNNPFSFHVQSESNRFSGFSHNANVCSVWRACVSGTLRLDITIILRDWVCECVSFKINTNPNGQLGHNRHCSILIASLQQTTSSPTVFMGIN